MRAFVSKKLVNLGTKLSPTLNDAGWLIPDASAAERKVIEVASRYTSTSAVAQWAFIQAIKEVERRGIAGDIVECGVWKGGNLIIAGLMRQQLGTDRIIWGYDTFAGMTAPTANDVKPGFAVDAQKKFESLNKGNVTDWCYVPIEDVMAAWHASVGQDPVKLVKGRVEDTLLDEANLPEKISILRLDTDFYESTKLELEILYPRLQRGGVVIIDDYGIWAGSRKAVDEYFGTDLPWLHYVNRGVRLAVKP
ncbi:TylF/MycF/NovP-related O-methyltransferase [Polymorphobacter sp.]|uniref:TylF/MycF/NovP-related O-methyltransferase n=1 Tax=Polymorphobacter sp. TaxID=1909290 RepID=UPI003F70C460